MNWFGSRSVMGLVTLLLTATSLMAQYPRKAGVKVMDYAMVSEDGVNAAAVVWIPGANMYVTAMLGDGSYMIEGFSELARPLWTSEVGIDLRGMWYNPKAKRLEANTAGRVGWYALALNPDGEPVGRFIKQLAGGGQPDDETVLSSNGKLVVGLHNDKIYYYNVKNAKFKAAYTLGRREDDSDWDLNQTSICYTGVENFPLAALDVDGGGIAFFDLKGKFLFYTKLPEDAARPRMYQFSFANQFAWIFNEETRAWTCYRVFH